MGGVDVPDPGEARLYPWWVRLSRRLNGERVCAVPGCIGLTESDRSFCAAHTDAIRARRRTNAAELCTEDGCPWPRDGGTVYGDLCREHGDAALLHAARQRAAPGRWNITSAADHPHW